MDKPVFAQEEALVLTVEGFVAYFLKVWQPSQKVTQNEAYEKVEAIHVKIKGHRKYSDLSSFVTAKSTEG